MGDFNSMIHDEGNRYFIECLLENLPNCIFWKDENLTFRWCNKAFAKQFGYSDTREIIGKNDYDFPWSEELRNKYISDEKELLASGCAKLNFEEEQVQNDGTIKTLIVSKVPIFDKDKKAVGLLGIYADMTELKIAEKLALENKLQKIEGIKSLKKVSEQVAHDIRSPLASLLMIIESCKNLPEPERISLRKVASSISNIANNLLTKYRDNESIGNSDISTKQHILVPLSLSEILSEKNYQYKNSQVKFRLLPDEKDSFIFIKANSLNFNRMISNLINNSVEAIENKKGIVDLKVEADAEKTKIIIQDNGKGMPQNIIDKITNNIPITCGKEDGSGIGFTQINGALQGNNGKMLIVSEVGLGTKITLTFPRAKNPSWITEKITIPENSTVVILDDDPSIHEAWKARLEPYKSKIKLRHFESDNDIMEFVSDFTEEKDKMFLLSDFELINQELNGLQVIEKLGLQNNATLVTSHYENQDILKQAIELNVKVLPKQLAATIPVEI